ncbi:pre-tRNA nuclear export protein [Ceratobasidium sp. 395]|nr:pre-tRNA nuclear export protein [Ceratobasidium sp. 395]
MSTEQNILSAIAIASDPAQDRTLQNEAVEYLNTVRAGATETWPVALGLFVGENTEQRAKQSVHVRLFALQVLDELLDNRQEQLVNAGQAQETYATLQSTLGAYIESEYVIGPAEATAPFIRNKFSHTLALLFLCTYPDQWPTFFTSISPLLHASPGASTPTLNPHVTTFFLRLLLEISGEIHDQTLKSARSFAASRHARDGRVRDAVRTKDAVGVNSAVLSVLEEVFGRLEAIRAGGPVGPDGLGAQQLTELVELAVRAFASYVPWVDINLTVTPVTINLLFKLLSDPVVPIRLATSAALLRIVQKGLKEPSDKLQLLRVLALGQVLEMLETKTRIPANKDDGDNDDEVSYRESLGKLTSGLGLELIKFCDDQSNPPLDIIAGAEELLQQLLPVMLRFLADDYDEISSSVFPMLSQIFVVYKRAKKNSPQTHLTPAKRAFLLQTLETLLQKMRWNPDEDPDDLDDDDRSAFENLRNDLRLFLDSISSIDEELVASAINTLAMNTLSRADGTVGWADAELAVYLVYLYGEFQKGDRNRGRLAFITVPEEVAKDKKKHGNWAEYPLTPHGEMIDALMRSQISSYPNNTVAIQYFETVGRYGDFFKIRKQYVEGVLTTFIDARGIHHPKESVRRRVFYIFHKFIKDCKTEIPAEYVTTIIDSMRDVLVVRAELPEPESSEQDLLSEALGSAGLFDSQLYLFESVGTLVSLLSKEPERQATVLQSITNPLLASLQQSIQTPITGPQDILPILQAHHVIRVLGSVSKGFPDVVGATPVPAPAWVLVLKQVAEAILLSLEAMNQHRAIRDAARFAFARIIASTGSNITQYIPMLMDRLLRQSQPVELVDFLAFLSFTVHKLQNEIFNVLDELISPLSTHIFEILAKPVEGTDDRLQHNDTKKAYLDFVTHIMTDQIHDVFVSERNKEQLPNFVQSIATLAEDVTDPGSVKLALAFLAKSATAFAQAPNAPGAQPKPNAPAATIQFDVVPGYQSFMYERLVPLAFSIPANPSFNVKDGQTLSATMEIGALLKQIYQARGEEATKYLTEVYLPSQNWPPPLITELGTKLAELDVKQFRRYFADVVRNSAAS